MGTPADRSYLSIREVLDLLLEEFPGVTISKIRFLENRGLIHPERTPSGYRKFYESDVERLRWILRQQREHFLPLKVIKGRLEEQNGAVGAIAPSLFDTAPERASSDARDPASDGELVANASGRARHPSAGVVAEVAAAEDSTGEREDAPAQRGASAPRRRRAPREEQADPAAQSYSRAELVRATTADDDLIGELEEYGLIAHRVIAGTECFDESACATLALAVRFRGFGIEARHLKMLKHAAEREAGLFSQVVTPLLLQRNPTARERAEEDLAELTALGAALREVFITGELRGFTGG